MAPTNYSNTFGTVGTFTVAASTRTAGVNEANHLGFVVAVTVTPNSGSPTEVTVQPAHYDGTRIAAETGNALIKALHVVTGA